MCSRGLRGRGLVTEPVKVQSSSDEGRQAVRDSERAEEAGESGRLVGLDDLSRPVRAELAVRSNLPTPAHRCRPVHAQPGSAPAVTGAGPAFRFSALRLSCTGARAVALACAAGTNPTVPGDRGEDFRGSRGSTTYVSATRLGLCVARRVPMHGPSLPENIHVLLTRFLLFFFTNVKLKQETKYSCFFGLLLR